MSRLFQSLLPRSVRGSIQFLFFCICGFFVCRFFKLAHPDYLFALAVIQGTWLGVWCQNLHQFAGTHVVPRFASRVTRFYLMVLLATGLFLTGFALDNHDLFSIIGLLVAIVVIVSFLVLLIRNWSVGLVLLIGIVFGMTGNPDVDREGIANLLSSSYLYPVSVLALLLSLAILYSLLNKPVNIEKRSLCQGFGNKIDTKRWHSVGTYGVSWSSHLKNAGVTMLLTLTFLHFYELTSDNSFIVWTMLIIFTPALSVGQSMRVAPRIWLSGAVHNRAQLSLALLVRLVGIAGIYTLAGLAVSLIANLLSINSPENYGSVFIAAFALSALNLGLISSYSSNPEEREFSVQRWMLLAGFYITVIILAKYPIEVVWGFTALIACSALYFLYRGHQRITKLDFISF